MMNNYYLGVDIGGTFIKLGVIDSEGNIIKKDKIETNNDLNYILKVIKRYLDKQKRERVFSGVGISLPGVISSDGTMQTAGSLKSLIGLNVKHLASQYLKLPVEIITDSKAVALAEGWLGNGKAFSNYVCVTLGSAIGGSIVINNQLYWGNGGLAGEFGISLMDREHSDYKLNSTSLHAGVVGGLCRKYSLAVKEETKDSNKIFLLADQGDTVALKYVTEFLNDIARMLVNISVAIAPDAILLGGGISENKTIMEKIQIAYSDIIENYSVLSLVQMPKVLPCRLANDAGIVGAVKLVIDAQIKR